jgi:hypothetical protein
MNGAQLRERAERARLLAKSMTTDGARDEFLKIASELEIEAKLVDETVCRWGRWTEERPK